LWLEENIVSYFFTVSDFVRLMSRDEVIPNINLK